MRKIFNGVVALSSWLPVRGSELLLHCNSLSSLLYSNLSAAFKPQQPTCLFFPKQPTKLPVAVLQQVCLRNMDFASQEQYKSDNATTQNNISLKGGGGGGGLLRFRSAPNSLFATHLEPTSDERNMSIGLLDDHLHFPDFEDKPSLLVLQPNHSSSSSSSPAAAFPHRNNLTATQQQQQHLRSDELPPQYPRNPIRSFGLARQSSSPAGFFNNGYAPVGGMGTFRLAPGPTGEVHASPSGLTDQPGFPSRMQSSSLGLLSRISEVGDEGMDAHSPTSTCHMKLCSGDVPFFRSAYPVDSWDDSAQFLENNGKMLPGSQIDQGSRPRPLSHHLSLPKNSGELSTMEKLMQFPDSVPCKIRAKRGCATHPRSIAERVRRTRISERMRKLQELVPNMDKQTNTSDMLDLAVDHIKDLQRQFKILSEKRMNCKCASQLLIRQQPY